MPLNADQRRWRRNLIRTAAYVILGIVIEYAGWLARIERVAYDLRATFCQRVDAPPSDRIVHIDVDDTSLDQIGRWPWDRALIADMIDEIQLAEPKVIAIDVLFGEPTPITFDRKGHAIDADAALAAAVKKSGRVLIPSSLSFDDSAPTSDTRKRLIALLSENPELTPEICGERLKLPASRLPALTEDFIAVRPLAIRDRIQREMAGGISDHSEIKRRLLPHSDPSFPGPLDRIYEREFNRSGQERSLQRFTLAPPPALANVIEADEAITPILSISEAARYGAFVDYLPERIDGAVRSVPLFARFHGRLIPHFGLVLACAMLDVDMKNVKLAGDHLVITRPDGNDQVIPLETRQNTHFGSVGMLMEIPMFGKRDGWLTMYDYPNHLKPVQHISMYEVWQARTAFRKLQANDATADRLLVSTLRLTDTAAADAYAAAPARDAARLRLIEETRANLKELIGGLSSTPDLDDATRKLLETYRQNERFLREAVEQNGLLQQQLDSFRAELRKKLKGRAALIGGAGTGHVDVVPTSLHARCPGVVVHGAIANAIMTGNFWRIAPRWVTYWTIAIVGTVTGLLVSSLSPRKGLMALMTVILAYLAINGLFLFHRHNLLVGVSGPLVSAVLVWAGITVPSFIIEIAERKRVTRSFSRYVDPELVEYLNTHPEAASIEGDSREMTMCFTDLKGFTSFTESLGAKTVTLLAKYMNCVIPCIRKNGGYVSRLMGDGIYFFFNAPVIDPNHAIHAVETVLAMHVALDELNRTLPGQGFPLLAMRAGICTGEVIVGDSGSQDFSDYTAVGNAVNTAARFESANKEFGTRTMAGEQTIKELNNQFLVRPIANLRVMGRTEGMNVYEPIARTDAATDSQRLLAKISEEVVTAYQEGDFSGCIDAADRLDRAVGPSRFAECYRAHAEECRISRPANFTGQIVLTEK